MMKQSLLLTLLAIFISIGINAQKSERANSFKKKIEIKNLHDCEIFSGDETKNISSENIDNAN